MSRTINGVNYKGHFFREKEQQKTLDELSSARFRLKGINAIKAGSVKSNLKGELADLKHEGGHVEEILEAEFTNGDDWESRCTILEGGLKDGREVFLVKHEDRSMRPFRRPLCYGITVYDHGERTFYKNWSPIDRLGTIFENAIRTAVEEDVYKN
mgnify:CR=1 FL=1